MGCGNDVSNGAEVFNVGNDVVLTIMAVIMLLNAVVKVLSWLYWMVV